MRWRAAVRFGLIVAALETGVAADASAQQDATGQIGHAVAAAIARCFQAPKGFQPPYPDVALLLNFRPDGNLDGPPQLGDPPGGDAKLSATTAAVLSAASECARVENAALFRQDYPLWKSLRLTFHHGER